MTNRGSLLPRGLTLSSAQIELLESFGRELRRMNQRINLVSSETETDFWKRHTAHCLALATRTFTPGSILVDWGTGGGLPAIPLAIVFPDCEIVGVDSVRKKVQSCEVITRRLGLTNCTFVHGRAEEVVLRTDYSVSRATAPLLTLWTWHTRVARRPKSENTTDGRSPAAEHNSDAGSSPAAADIWPRGLICLKGGDLSGEIADLREAVAGAGSDAGIDVQTFPLSSMFEDPWFDEKVIVLVRGESADQPE